MFAIRQIALRLAAAATLASVIMSSAAIAAEPSASLARKAPDAAALLATAGDKGTVPVIITLAGPASAQALGTTDDAAVAASVRSVVDPFVADVLQPATASTAAGTASPVKTMPYLPMVATSLSPADLERVAASPAVVQIVRDGLNKPTLTQSIPLIGGVEAAAAGATGSGRTVAILDTGVQFTHPFVAGRIAGSSCHSSNIQGGHTVCPNGQTSQYNGNAGVNCTVSADCSHGTHVAGIAAGSRPGWTPPRGVAPSSRIYAVQVFSNFGGDLGAWDSDIIAGLQDVFARRTTLGIVAANLSLGGGAYAAYCNAAPVAAAITQLRNAGVATVISSGNDGFTNKVGSPGCVQAAITVGSSTKANQISSFSNMAPMVDLMAPGSSIVSSVPTNAYDNYSGTSMAAPHVTGAFAALKSAVPNATVSQIEAALKATGVPIVDNRSGGVTTRPRIDINLALRQLRGQSQQPPVNDAFARATTIPWTRGATRLAGGTNVRATLQSGERRFSTAVQATVWWKLTAAVSERIVVSTAGSSFNTTLAIYTGSAVNALSTVAFNDNATGVLTSALTFSAVAGRTYYIQVGGSGSARGAIILNLAPPPPANDNFANAIAVTPVNANATATGTNVSATLQTGEPKFNSSVSKTVWWKVTPTASGARSIDTIGSGFDTMLAVYRGSALNALTLVAANDDESPASRQSRVVTNLVAGTTYYIQVSGYNDSAGAVTLHVKPVVPPANDNFANAISFSAANAGTTLTGSNIGATLQTGEPKFSSHVDKSIWWKFTPTTTGTRALNTFNSGLDTMLAIYRGSALNALTLVVSNDDASGVLQSRVQASFTAGTTYYVQVSGYNGATGSIRLALEPKP